MKTLEVQKTQFLFYIILEVTIKKSLNNIENRISA